VSDHPAGSVKFLLVDDLEENLIALSALLARPEVTLLTARSGPEALELLLVHDVALAILDVQMPDMDGFELAELMRGKDQTKNVPIIFVTAGSREGHRVFRGYEAGAVDFLFKPIDPFILRHKAEIFLRLHEQKQELERLSQELAHTLRLNEMFVAAVSHDLRSPLSAITMAAEILLKAPADAERVKRAATRVQSSSKRMATLIDDLLDLARARLSGGFAIQPTATDLGARAKKVIAEQQATAADRAIELGSSGDITLEADGDRFEQLLTNLVGNALRHGSRDAPIRVQIDGQAADDVVLTVWNAGSLDPSLGPAIFDPFRSGVEKARRSGGLGLGLYIARQIARAHGGDVTLTNEGEGVLARVDLPRKQPPAPPSE
jgi:signal transduction histidine kinase